MKKLSEAQKVAAAKATRKYRGRLAKERMAAWKEQRHRVRCANPNPACRVYPGMRREKDKPEDVAANEAARAYEIKQWS